MKVKVKWFFEHHPDYNTSFGCYNNYLVNSIYLRNQIDEGYKPNKCHIAYYSMEIPLWKYVVYHELFHHLTQMDDGEKFEEKLREFIIKEEEWEKYLKQI